MLYTVELEGKLHYTNAKTPEQAIRQVVTRLVKRDNEGTLWGVSRVKVGLVLIKAFEAFYNGSLRCEVGYRTRPKINLEPLPLRKLSQERERQIEERRELAFVLGEPMP